MSEKNRREIMAARFATEECVAPPKGPNAHYLPNVVVTTHEMQRAFFYDDLLAGKVVMVNFTSIADEEETGVTANLARVQEYLGERLGRDVFMYSITTDPERDTPEALAELARRHGARPGWLFLTAKPSDVDLLKAHFFVDGGYRGVDHAHHTHDCSRGLVRYGNEAVGLWGAVPGRAEPEWIAKRIDWVSPKPASETPRRRGPVPGRPFPGAVAISLLLLVTSWLGWAGPARAEADADCGTPLCTDEMPCIECAAAPAPPPPATGDCNAEWTYAPCPAGNEPIAPGICHPYPQARPAGSQQTTTCEGNRCESEVVTGESLWPPCNPFDHETFPGNNFLPTIYTDAFDSEGRQMPNTLPSTPDIPYNLHLADPVVTVINPLSPEDDLAEIFDDLVRQSLEVVALEGRAETGFDRSEIEFLKTRIPERIRMGLAILEGNPVENRAYSGLPLLHYNGPEKARTVEPVFDAEGNKIGGNVAVHQVWYGGRIESDVGFLDVSQVTDVPWTVTYTVDVLNRGHDDFSPFVTYWDRDFSDPEAKPHIGMDQSFFNMDDGTRTVFEIGMTDGEYYNLVYTWGWRMHPPRIQVMENAGKKVNYAHDPDAEELTKIPGTSVGCPAQYQGKTLAEMEVVVFGTPPSPQLANEDPERYAREHRQWQLEAIGKIGDMAPAKRMWKHLREAAKLAEEDRFAKLAELVRDRALPAFFAWRDRTHVPCFRTNADGSCADGFDPEPEADVTIVYVNNTIYGEITSARPTTRGVWVRWDDWELRGEVLNVAAYNADTFVHAYTIADFGGSRGWENQFKSSVRVAGSGCWFTFGRAHWFMVAGAPKGPQSHGYGGDYLCVPPVDGGGTPGFHRFDVTLNFEPSRRLRFYQFDPLHHDVAIFSVH